MAARPYKLCTELCERFMATNHVCPHCNREQDIDPLVPLANQTCRHCGEPLTETAIAARPMPPQVLPAEAADEWDDQDRPLIRASVPGKVQAAGVIWLIFGCLSIAGALLQLALAFAGRADPAPGSGGAVGAAGVRGASSGGACCGILFGAVFLHAGFQCIRGTARDVLGNGIGSLLFGLLYTAIAVIILLIQPAEPSELFTLGFLLVLALALYVAGALALAARSEYKAFQQATRQLNRPGRSAD
jgi:hypothetical protein